MKRSRSLLSNFIRALLFIIVIPTFLMNTILYGVLKKKATSNHSAMMVSNMEYISKNLEDKLRDIKLKTSMMVADRDIHNLLYRWKNEKSSILKNELAYDIDGYITSRFDYLGEIESAYFFLDDEDYYAYKSNRVLADYLLRATSWYKKIKNVYQVRSMESLGGSIGRYDDTDVFTIVSGMEVFVSSSTYIEPLEVAVIEYKNELFEGIYSDFKDVYSSDVIIFDELGNVRLTSNPDYRGKSINSFPKVRDFANKHNIVSGVRVGDSIHSLYKTPKSNWIIYTQSDFREITRSISDQLILFNIFFIIILLVFAFFSIFYFNRVVGSLRSLISSMKRVEKGCFKEGIEVKGYGEIRELESAFDNMIQEINLLMIERDKKDKEKRVEEIKALQAQISPHFIYNTLNCIKLMSMMARQNNISDLTDAFMNLLSGMFKDQKMVIPVETELNYLEHYIYIMRVRFGETFTVKWDIDDEVIRYGVLKLVLQPLVENAITHGVSQKEDGGGVITISGKLLKDSILLTVEDNGPGITNEKIDELLSPEYENEGPKRVGFNNVNRRVKLNYGETYGLSIESEIGHFTRVNLTIPKIELI